jgi:hypothetical protein
MAQINIEGDTLVVNVEGMDKLWAFKSRLEIPLSNVRGATLDPGIVTGFKGIRTMGTNFPGVIVAGTFRTEGERVFWDVRDPTKALVIELTDETYARLIVQVDNPRETADRIEQAKRS